VLFCPSQSFYSAIIKARSLRLFGPDIQTEVQKTDPRVDQVLERANDHFRKGKLNLEDNKREQAETSLTRPLTDPDVRLDVRASQRCKPVIWNW